MAQFLYESGMQLGPFNDEDYFKIENSPLHLSMKNGVKSVECILTRFDSILFIEAKTSCPNIENSKDDDEKKEKCDAYFKDIREKFEDAFNMYLTICVEKNFEAYGMGENLLDKDIFKKRSIKFILIVKNAHQDWLLQITSFLEKELIKLRRIWKVEIRVLNEEIAIARHFAIRNDNDKESTIEN